MSSAHTTVVEATWVIPVEPAGALLRDHAVIISGERIAAIKPVHQAREDHPDAERVALTGHAIIPGLINLHTHAAMTLMRGLGDDLALMEWLNHRIWPVEMRLVSPEFVHDGTLLACAEMLRGGVTCFNDMYFFPEAAARAALGIGMRAALGIIVVEFRSPYATDAADYVSKGLGMRDALKHEPLLSFCLAPHAPFNSSDWRCTPLSSTSRSTFICTKPPMKFQKASRQPICGPFGVCRSLVCSVRIFSLYMRSTSGPMRSHCLRNTPAMWRTALPPT